MSANMSLSLSLSLWLLSLLRPLLLLLLLRLVFDARVLWMFRRQRTRGEEDEIDCAMRCDVYRWAHRVPDHLHPFFSRLLLLERVGFLFTRSVCLSACRRTLAAWRTKRSHKIYIHISIACHCERARCATAEYRRTTKMTMNEDDDDHDFGWNSSNAILCLHFKYRFAICATHKICTFY